MKTARSLTAAFLLCAAGAGFAAENSGTVPHALSRADVRAQVIEARRNGTMIESEADRYVAETYYLVTGRMLKTSAVIAAVTPALTQAQVPAQSIKPRRDGAPAGIETGTTAPTEAKWTR